ncbi:TPA: hypothetical protein IX400_001774 [Enterococcus faecium]|nr:hypothetical protein [Enterococcus faecium]EFF28743.1 hypothetical protein EfmU0317_2314 [Enterococcus faecium U0317]EJY25075.1 hypothetical protein HMPREF1355_02076 [Enterococcus faecium 515]ELB78961.1 hypothetical protein OM7_03312 [Enterococcus faecium EnGen0046]MCX3947575.1 hypothetical protein [Enterococcus faecium]BDP74266.1 hypothetical protein EfmAA96_20510 [Enterococcus faecium]
MGTIKIYDLFDLTHIKAIRFLDTCEYPWEALADIGNAVLQISKSLE